MDVDTPIAPEVAENAKHALMAVLSDLLETAADLCASPAIAEAAGRIGGLCRDSASLAEAVTIITRRTAP